MIWIYGASGHGRVILDILEASGFGVAGFVDDKDSLHEWLGYPVIRKENIPVGDEVIMGIGANDIRKKVVESLPCSFVNAVHPGAVVSRRSAMGTGNVIMAGAVIQSGSTLGNHVIVNTGATVDHDCEIGDYAHISPGVTLCGKVKVGSGTWVGAGSTVIQGVTIGRNVVVGAGSVIRKNVPDQVLIVGNPPKILKKL